MSVGHYKSFIVQSYDKFDVIHFFLETEIAFDSMQFWVFAPFFIQKRNILVHLIVW